MQSHAIFYDSLQTLNQAVATHLVNNIQQAIQKRDICHMVFPGGQTPKPIFEFLIKAPIPWSKLHLYPSDERCVQRDSVERNDRLIDEFLFPYVPLPEENLHRIPAELGPEEAARVYLNILKNTPPFDIAWIGVGEDGHIASLFPGSKLLEEKKEALAVYDSPKPPSERVSIGLSCLRQATERLVIIAGNEKKNLYKQMHENRKLPVSLIEPTLLFILK